VATGFTGGGKPAPGSGIRAIVVGASHFDDPYIPGNAFSITPALQYSLRAVGSTRPLRAGGQHSFGLNPAFLKLLVQYA